MSNEDELRNICNKNLIIKIILTIIVAYLLENNNCLFILPRDYCCIITSCVY